MYREKRAGDLVNHDKWGLGVVRDHPSNSDLFIVVFYTKHPELRSHGLGDAFWERCWSFSRSSFCMRLTLLDGELLENV